MTRTWSSIRNLRLAVEVISPSSGRHDRIDKRHLYQEHRVETYGIVDPDAELIEVWQPNDERPWVATEVVCWRVRPDAPDLAVDLKALFRGLPRPNR